MDLRDDTDLQRPRLPFAIYAVIGVLASVVGAYYYLRIIKIMWFDEPVGAFQPMSVELRAVLGLSGAFVLFYVIIGGSIGEYAEAAAKTFF